MSLGNDQHCDLWRPTAENAVTALGDAGSLERTVPINAPWALITTSISPSGQSFGLYPADANVLYERCCNHLESLGVTTVYPDPDMLVADSEHVWGLQHRFTMCQSPTLLHSADWSALPVLNSCAIPTGLLILRSAAQSHLALIRCTFS